MIEVKSARLVYAAFKRLPAGHVFVIFQLSSGEDVAISPEADVRPGVTFSLTKGLRKTYSLRYAVERSEDFLEQYELEGRRVREYPLDLSGEQLTNLYIKMLARAEILSNHPEWYHTLFNSCVTNVMNHIDEIKMSERNALRRMLPVLMPRLLAHV